MIENLSKNYESVRESIAVACQKCARNPHEITIVAISKTFPFSSVIDLNRLGHVDFGENKVKELRDKYYNISFQYSGKMNWHFVGHLQTNKVKDIVAFIHLIHSVDSFNLAEEIENGLRPALVIAVPVGFVNVVESKERLFAGCTQYGVPAIAAMGRKGGSNVAAAICNALVYSAAGMLDPTDRGWK